MEKNPLFKAAKMLRNSLYQFFTFQQSLASPCGTSCENNMNFNRLNTEYERPCLWRGVGGWASAVTLLRQFCLQKNCYRRSTSSNTQSVAKKKGKTLTVTWLLSRWSRTWKQKVQILSSQDSAVVVPPFHRAEILTCHFLFLLHPCYSSTFMSNTLKNYCVCLIIHIFF